MAGMLLRAQYNGMPTITTAPAMITNGIAVSRSITVSRAGPTAKPIDISVA